MLSRIPSLYIAHIERKGRGVFSGETIPEGSLIESCPVLVLPPKDLKLVHQTLLHDYYFYWGDNTRCAIALGYGSLYNHASDANADYRMDLEQETIDIFSLRTIYSGEEITINYTEGGAQASELWFEEQ